MRTRLNNIVPLEEKDLSSVSATSSFLMETEHSRAGDDYALCMHIVVSKANAVSQFRDSAQDYLDRGRTSNSGWLSLRRELLGKTFGSDMRILRLARTAWTDAQRQKDREGAAAYGRRMTLALNQFRWVTRALDRAVTTDWEAERLDEIVNGFCSRTAIMHCNLTRVDSVKSAIGIAVTIDD